MQSGIWYRQAIQKVFWLFPCLLTFPTFFFTGRTYFGIDGKVCKALRTSFCRIIMLAFFCSSMNRFNLLKIEKLPTQKLFLITFTIGNFAFAFNLLYPYIKDFRLFSLKKLFFNFRALLFEIFIF